VSSSRNLWVGAFVVGGLALFALGLFLIGDRRKLFADSFEVVAEFKELGGLQNGAKVKVGGMDAGEVRDIEVPAHPEAKFRVRMRVLEKLHPVVRTDSVATIQNEGVLGNKFMKIDPGSSQAPPAPVGSTIQGKEPFDFADLLQQVRQVVEQAQGKMDEVFATITGAASHADQLIGNVTNDIEAIAASGKRISADVSIIIGGVRDGRGTIGKLFTDESLSQTATQIAKDFQKTGQSLQRTTKGVEALVQDAREREIVKQLQQTMANLQQITQQAREVVATFQAKERGGQSVTVDLRDTLSYAREAMSDLAENMEALKHSFFFRGFYKNRGFYDLDSLTSAEYLSKDFAKGRQRERVWVPGTDLFVTTPSGQEQLSDKGKQDLSEIMARFFRHGRKNLIVIEGYSGKGSEDEQLLNSRDRAEKVRNFLLSKFQMDPESIGAIPIGAVAAQDAAHTAWEGVALVLYYKAK